MPIMQTRRRFLTTLSLADTAGFLRTPTALAAEGALEPTPVRFSSDAALCLAPQFVAKEFLSAEGFTDIRYVHTSQPGAADPVARGDIDFDLNVGWTMLD